MMHALRAARAVARKGRPTNSQGAHTHTSSEKRHDVSPAICVDTSEPLLTLTEPSHEAHHEAADRQARDQEAPQCETHLTTKQPSNTKRRLLSPTFAPCTLIAEIDRRWPRSMHKTASRTDCISFRSLPMACNTRGLQHPRPTARDTTRGRGARSLCHSRRCRSRLV